MRLLSQVLKLLKAAAAILAIWFLIIVPLWYLGHYLLEPQNSYRGEYLQGAALSVMFLAPAPVIVFFVSRYFLHKRGL